MDPPCRITDPSFGESIGGFPSQSDNIADFFKSLFLAAEQTVDLPCRLRRHDAHVTFS